LEEKRSVVFGDELGTRGRVDETEWEVEVEAEAEAEEKATVRT